MTQSVIIKRFYRFTQTTGKNIVTEEDILDTEDDRQDQMVKPAVG